MEYRDKNTLEELYCEERKSLKEIGERFGVSKSTIHRWMDNHGIERRTDKDAGSEKRRVGYARYFIDSEGYPAWQAWNGKKGGHDLLRVHQLLAIAEGADPHRIFNGVGNTVVHHDNGCKIDNRPKNIEVTSAADHGRHHIQERSWTL